MVGFIRIATYIGTVLGISLLNVAWDHSSGDMGGVRITTIVHKDQTKSSMSVMEVLGCNVF